MKFRTLALLSLTLLAGCRHKGDIVDARYGVYQVRSACPVVALPGLRSTVVVASLELASSRPVAAVARLAGRTPHQLPFATAPPAIA